MPRVPHVGRGWRSAGDVLSRREAGFSLVGVILAGFAGEWFGDAGVRAVAAVVLVLARAGSDLAVLWFPLWGPARLVKPLPPVS